jgi:hypothetical protein
VIIFDTDHPLTAKAAFVLGELMPSRIWIARLIECNRLKYVTGTGYSISSQSERYEGAIVENFIVCYRGIASDYQWDIVDAGAIRHGMIQLKYGDTMIHTIT